MRSFGTEWLPNVSREAITSSTLVLELKGTGAGLSPTDAYTGTFQGLVCFCPIRTQPHVRQGVPVTL